MFGFFKRFGKSKSGPRKEAYDYCQVHGELTGDDEIPANGIRLFPYMTNRAICPLCFTDWMLRNFPVETRVREVQSSFLGYDYEEPPRDSENETPDEYIRRVNKARGFAS